MDWLKLKKYFKVYFGIILLIFAVTRLVACYPITNYDKKAGFKDKIDPAGDLSRDEYANALLPPHKKDSNTDSKDAKGDKETSSKKTEPTIPEFSDILVAPPAPETNYDKLVSIAVTEDIPVKDVLIELSRLADVDMEIDPGITGGVIFRVKDKPFKDVIKQIADLAGLRYRSKAGVLRIERDTPYIVNYSVDFLNVTRSGSNNVSINTNVLGQASASNSSGNNSNTSNSTGNRNNTTNNNNNQASNSAGGGLSSGSSNSITSNYDGNLWGSVETTVQSILAFKPGNLSMQIDPVLASSSSNPTTSYTLNKQAGIITILATEKQHTTMKEYLDSVRKASSAQVLIEAKIVEVTLDNQYRSGINWGTLMDRGRKLGVSANTAYDRANDFISIGTLTNPTSAASLNSSVSLVDQFGVSRTLSSPRLHAINNQQAILTFAENSVYFTLKAQEQQDTAVGGKTTLTIDSTLNSVPIGVILTLQPSINLDTQEITMSVRPTLSKITGSVSDPGVDILVARNNITLPTKSLIPVVEVRELDSILKIKSGGIMVIGGLMKEINSNTDKGIPGAGKVPVFGNLFKTVEKDNQVVETVIFIKATIIPSEDAPVADADKNIYKTFTHDPRPLVF